MKNLFEKNLWKQTYTNKKELLRLFYNVLTSIFSIVLSGKNWFNGKVCQMEKCLDKSKVDSISSVWVIQNIHFECIKI